MLDSLPVLLSTPDFGIELDMALESLQDQISKLEAWLP